MKVTTTTYEKLILQELTERNATQHNPCTLEQLKAALKATLTPLQGTGDISEIMLERALHNLNNDILIELHIPEYRAKENLIEIRPHWRFVPYRFLNDVPFNYLISLKPK
jgi:hypothetical protein